MKRARRTFIKILEDRGYAEPRSWAEVDEILQSLPKMDRIFDAAATAFQYGIVERLARDPRDWEIAYHAFNAGVFLSGSDTSRGEGGLQSAKRGHVVIHGTAEQKREKWERVTKEVARLRAQGMSHKAACERVVLPENRSTYRYTHWRSVYDVTQKMAKERIE